MGSTASHPSARQGLLWRVLCDPRWLMRTEGCGKNRGGEGRGFPEGVHSAMAARSSKAEFVGHEH